MGKSHFGHLLRDGFEAEYVNGELMFLERYGSIEAFVEHKARALTEFFQGVRALRLSVGRTIVVEASGLSDRRHLQALMAESTVLLVGFFADRDTCVRRVAERPRGRNFDNDLKNTSEFHAFWLREIAPTYSFDLTLDTSALSEAVVIARVSEAASLRERAAR